LETRLSRICSAIIEAGWLAALVVAPLFFNTFSNRVFEPDKLHLVRSIALLMAVAWIVQLLDSGLRRGEGVRGVWERVRRTPLVLPALVLVLSYLLSTALSVVPRISFFGSYVRMQGTFSYLSYVAIFVMMLTNLRTRDQVSRLLHTVILTSLPISIYGILQNAGLDPLPWGGNVRERVAANMGNAIFVAAYLIMAVFLTLERLLNSLTAMLSTERGGMSDSLRAGGYLFILVVQLIAIVYTQSRGPWMGLAAGLYVFAMLGLLLLARWAVQRKQVPAGLGWLTRHLRSAWLTLIGLTVAGLLFLVMLNMPNGPLAGVCNQRYVSRLCTVFSTTEGTNAVRVLIWEGVADMMLAPHAPIQQPDGTPDALNALRPLVGYGPESMWVVYNRFYPPELAHYESRNASPDRSHNETFDTLVRGGLFQFAAQLVLYSAIFYYALRWLGLMRGANRRRIFFAFLVGGGALGVIVPLLVEGSLRLAGIGLPAGLIAGVMVYVTVDLLLSSRLAEETATAGAASGDRQTLVLALFAAIVAHFVEVHFGIAIASTLTHFWAFTALLVVTGMGWIEANAEPAPVAAPSPVLPAETGANAARTGTKRKAAATRAAQAQRQAASAPAATLPTGYPSPLRRFLPYAGIAALVTIVLAWDYTVNQTGAQDALTILRNAFTLRVSNFQVVSSPMLLILVLFTWLVGGMLAVTETAAATTRGAADDEPPALRVPALLLTAIYAAVVIGVFLVYGLIQAGRLSVTGLSGIDVYHRYAGHIVVFDIVLLLSAGVLAVTLALAGSRPSRAAMFGRSPVLSLGVGAVLAVLALLVVVNVNLQTVQADTYYKSGLSFEGANDWESSVVLYRQASTLEPQEDYYYLFLGRALLQLGQYSQPGTPTLPENLDQTPTGDLQALIERGLRSGTREDILRSAHAALVAARRLNPLNTDHSANLARLHRAWAFTGAGTAANLNDPDSLRELLISDPDLVNRGRLDRSLAYYQQTLSLSPNNAGLWNELATVQFILNDLAGAEATLQRSLDLDQQFSPTYLLLGDVLNAAGDATGALDAYQQAAELAPNNTSVLSAAGVSSARAGDTDAAVAAFRRMIQIETNALESAAAQLDQLDAMAAAAGGYARLQSSATNRQGLLQGQINSRRSQIALSYRNIALVLRDAGRIEEALTAAQQAAEYAGQNDLPAIEQLIAELQERLTP
jgi:tetratricopeptide (TPR) repeat protein